MSTTVDTRVVSMQFDNSQFERNVATSMSTLDKLKQKLNFSGASRGLEEINTATKNVNMTGLGSAVETVTAKFSALQVMGVTALANITNSAVNAGKRMVSALTIDPVKSGFSEYELKMNSVQTIMASTGKDIETVNKYLEELNKYADQTIYSFSDMTQNIGKFTNAGVELEDAVAAIKGISNEAALSGANANEASRAMYNFSQALSAGYVKLIDWKSIENANMATKGFKEELIKTALELGTVTKAADGMYQTLEGTEFNATKNFNEVLQDQWMTSEVLITTLKKYSDTTTEIGKKASAAATEVKTFSQLWDTLKESAQSGWARTWELLVGDLLEAKSLLTGISKFVGGIIDKTSDWRNNILGGALANPFEGITKVLNKVNGATEGIAETVEMLESITEMANRVIRGDFGNGEDRIAIFTKQGWNYAKVQNKVNELMGSSVRHAEDEAEAQENATEARNESIESLIALSDAELKALGCTEKEIESLRALAEYSEKTGISIKDLSENIDLLNGRTLLINSFKNLFGSKTSHTFLNSETFAALETAGIATEKWKDEMIDAALAAGRLTKVGDDLYKIGNKTFTSNQLFGEGLKENWAVTKSVYQGLLGVITLIKEAWQSVFPPKTTEERAKGLYNIIAALHKFSTTMTMSAGTADKLRRTFKGLFAIIDVILTLTAGPLKIAFKILTEILSMFDMNILDLTAGIGDALVAFRDWIDNNNLLTKGLELLKPYILGLAKWISSLFNSVSNSDILSNLADKIVKLKDAFVDWFKGLKDAENIPQYILQGLIGLVKNAGSLVGSAFNSILTAIKNLIAKIPGVGDWFAKLGDSKGVAKDILAGLVEGLKGGAGAVWDTIINIGKTILEKIKGVLGIHSPSREFFEIGKNIIQGLINGVKALLGGLWNLLGTIATKCIDFVKRIDFGTLFAGLMTAGLIVSGLKIAKALEALASPLEGLGDMFEEIGDAAKMMAKGVKNYLNSKAILNMAIAIAVLAASVVMLTLVPKEKLWSAVGAVAALTGCILAMSIAAAVLNKMGGVDAAGKKNYMGMVVSLLAISGAMLILALALKQIADIDVNNIGPTLMVMAGLIAGVMLMAVALKRLSVTAAGVQWNDTGVVLLKMALAVLILVQVVKMAAGMSGSEAFRGVVVVAAIELLFIAILKVSEKAGEFSSNAGGLLIKMGIALGIMLAVVRLAALMKASTVLKGVANLAIIELLFMTIVAVSKFAGEHASKAGSMVLKMSVAMLLMLGVVKMAANVDRGMIDKAFGVIIAIEILFASMMLVSRLANEHSGKAGSALVKMAMALLIVVGAMALLALFDPSDMARSLIAVTIMLACFAGIAAALGTIKDTSGMFKTLIMVTVIIGLMIGALVAFTFIDPAKLAFALGALSVFSLLIMGLIAVTKNAGQLTIKDIAPVLLVVGAMAAVIAILSVLDVETSIETVGGLVLLLAGVTAVTFALSKMHLTVKEAFKTVTALTLMAVPLLAFVGVLAAAQDVVASIDTIGALILLVSASTLLLYALKPLGKHAGNAMLGVLALTTMAAPLALFVAILAGASGIKNAIANVTALSMLMTVLTALLIPLAVIGNFALSALIGVGLLTLMAIPLLAFVAVLALAKNVEAAASTVLALIVLATVCTLLLIPLAAIGKFGLSALIGIGLLTLMAIPLLAFVGVLALAQNVDTAAKTIVALIALATVCTLLLIPLALVGSLALPALIGIGLLTLMAVPLLAFVGVLALAQNVNVATETVTALIALATVCTLLLIPLTLVGALVAPALLGVLALTAMVVPLVAFVGILYLMEGLEDARTNADILTDLMWTMSGVLTVLAVVGPMALVGEAAVLGLAAVVTAILGLVVIIGGLMEKVPILQDFLDTGIAVMEKFAYGIGSMIGNIIKGFAETVSSILPTIGTHLSQFMENLQGFIDGARSIDESVLDGVGRLALCVLELTGANLLTGLSKMLGMGLPKFGRELTKFMDNAKPFIDGSKDIDAEAIAGVKTLADAVLILTGTDLVAGLTSWLTGGSSFADFAEQLPLLGTGLKGLCDNLGKNFDSVKVTAAAEAVKSLAQVACEIPNEGGVLGFFAGNNDMGVFAEDFPKLGEGLSGFCSKLGEGFNAATVEAAAKALKTIAVAAQEIPNTGGLLAEIVGDNVMSTFAEDFPKLGTALTGLCTNLGEGFNAATVRAAAGAIKTLATASSEIPNTGGLLAAIVGDNDLAMFASGLPNVGVGLAGLCANLGENFSSDKVIAAADAIQTLATASSTIENTGGLLAAIVGDNDLAMFASGLPNVGAGLSGLCAKLGENFSPDNVTAAATAIQTLTGVQINEKSGFLGWITGETTLNDFATNLPSVGAGLAGFCSNLGTDFNPANVSAAAEAITLLTNISPGKKDTIWNNNSLKDFATDLPDIASSIAGFTKNLSGVGADQVKIAKDNIQAVIDIGNINIDAMTSLSAQLKQAGDSIVNVMKTIGSSTATGFTNAIKAAYGTFESCGKTAMQSFVNGAASVETNFGAIITQKLSGAGGSALEAMNRLGSLCSAAFGTAINSASFVFENAGQFAVQKFIDGMKKVDVGTTAKDIATAAAGKFKQTDSFAAAGRACVQGFANGMSGSQYIATSAATSVMNAAIAAAKEAAGINSPSKVFYGLGNFSVQGFTNALHDSTSTVYAAGEDMAKASIDGMNNAVSRIAEAINTDIDSQPTIRPVLDLTDVESNAGRIGGMLNGQTLSVGANYAGSISAMMNRRSQNGSNADIIAALKDLRGDLSTNRGDTYQINGVTYDDGSNIAEFAHAVVRQARIGRRV